MKSTLFSRPFSVSGFLFLLFSVIPLFSQGQNFQIRGNVIGEKSEALSGATVVLLEAKDSVLISYGISDSNGQFELKRIKAGTYLLQVSYVGYSNFSETILLSTNDLEKTKIREIQLSPNINLLDQVEVRSEHIPIQIIGDTIQYNADAFKTQTNAVVEDLLRQLPGVEVGRDGSVKAQGKDVEHVFVDGKEFFGDDPLMATKNLPADAIDKVQVFDKASDNSEFTGIDDGQREKTINLTLKEGKKNGIFGNVTAGYGDRNRYEGKANINRFNSKMQFSAIGMANNTNQQGFSLGEYLEFMGGLSNLMAEGGGRMSFNAADIGIPLGNDLYNGLMKTGAGGINFNFDFPTKTKLRSSYFFNRLSNTIEEELNRQNFLETGQTYNSNQLTNILNTNTGHRLNVNLEHDIDPSQSLRFRSNLSVNNGQSISNKFGQTFNPENSIENSNLRKYDSQAQQLKWNSTLLYRKRLKKLGRVFVTDLSTGMNNNNQQGILDAFNGFTNSLDTIKQQQDIKGDQFNFRAKASYIEPLGKRKYLEFSYAINNIQEEEKKEFYDLEDSPREEKIYNEQLSRHFANDYLYNTPGLSYKLNRENYQWTVALNLQHSQLRGKLLSNNQRTDNSFVHLLPRFFWNYDLSDAKNFTLQYLTNVNAPSIVQLNPVIDNNDPLRIYQGNPLLQPEYTHRLNLNFSSFDQFSFTSIFASLNTSYTQNKIYDARKIDSLFRQIVLPINVKDDFLANAYFSFDTPLRFIKSKFNFSLSSNYNKGIEVINEVENNTNRFINIIDLSLENRKKEIIDILIGGKISHNVSKYSINTNFNQSFFTQSYYADLTINFNLPKLHSWSLENSLDIDIYSNESFAGAQVVPVWNAGLSKFVLDKRGQVKFLVNDLLNKNIGINRSSSFNYTQEQKIKSLGRYFLVSFTWKISKFGSPDSGIDIEVN